MGILINEIAIIAYLMTVLFMRCVFQPFMVWALQAKKSEISVLNLLTWAVILVLAPLMFVVSEMVFYWSRDGWQTFHRSLPSPQVLMP